MGEPRGRRASGRPLTEIACEVTTPRDKGVATIADLSTTGARLEESSVLPAPREAITLNFELGERPIEVSGWVVRFTQTGFAIEFDELDAEATRAFANVASLVPTRSRDQG